MTIGGSLVSSDTAPAVFMQGAALDRSRQYCEQLTREKAKNFYYGMKLLPEPKRSAMFALYAYMRLIDDIADEEDGRSLTSRLSDLETWRRRTHAVLQGRDTPNDSDVWPAFADMVHRHGLPAELFDDVIAGQQQDLRPHVFETFDGLYEYCYRVAGTVGLASIYIWGFEGGQETQRLAIDRGVAFQLTNILRDLREDAARGRTYLPREDLTAWGMDDESFRASRGGEPFCELMQFQIARAESYYEQSRNLDARIARDSRPTLVAMTEIYHGLLRKLAIEPERALRERVSLSLMTKLLIGWRASWAR